MECQHYKKVSSYLNYKLRRREALQELPPEIVKLYEEIEIFKNNLGKFIGGHEAFKKLLRCQGTQRQIWPWFQRKKGCAW